MRLAAGRAELHLQAGLLQALAQLLQAGKISGLQLQDQITPFLTEIQLLHGQLWRVAQGTGGLIEQAKEAALVADGAGIQVFGKLRLEVDDARVGRK